MARARQRRAFRPARAIGARLEQQVQTLAETLRRLIQAPLASAMTVGAIGIALALPAMLHLLLVNLEQLAGDWERNAAISLFLDPAMDEAGGAELAARLRARPDISRVELISRADGLAQFREYSGLGGALDQLDANPLPVVLALYPAPGLLETGPLEAIARDLEQVPGAGFARIDTQWARRLDAILGLLRHGALLLGTALALAVLLVIGNTIRLEIENRRDEILIMDLVGATRGFVRRPFLYSGAWYGLLGGLLAWLLVAVAMLLLAAPVARLAALYHTDVRLTGLDARALLLLLGGGTALGVLGSWLAVGRHLIGAEPD